MAMQRLRQALAERGHESKFLVGRTRFPEDSSVQLIWDVIAPYRSLKTSLQSRIGNQIEKYYGLHPWANITNLRIVDSPLVEWAEIVDLRNLFGGFFNLGVLPALSAKKAVAWRLPDLWAVTGHCAYPYDCERWKTGCHHCPLLTPEGRKKVEPTPTILDGTRSVWKFKKKIYDKSRIHVIVTTEWMRKQISESILQNAVSVNVISNGVQLDVYRPLDKAAARKELGLPQDKKILLWAAGAKGNYRKGYHLAVKALESIDQKMADPPMLITMGRDEGWQHTEQIRNIQHFGYVRDSDRQVLVYSAADAFICSTLADAQPQTALESFACGTPVIAFDLGPMPEIITDGATGFLARETTAQALEGAISRFLDQDPVEADFQANCRRVAEDRFDLRKQTAEYVRLYEKILG